MDWLHFRGAQFFNATHKALNVILRYVALSKTSSALFPSYEYYMLHVVILWRQNQQPTSFRLLFLRFNLFNFHFLVGTTNKLLILWEELQLCLQLKQTTMMRWALEASQMKFFTAVFICCVFFFRVKQFRDVCTSHWSFGQCMLTWRRAWEHSRYPWLQCLQNSLYRSNFGFKWTKKPSTRIILTIVKSFLLF